MDATTDCSSSCDTIRLWDGNDHPANVVWNTCPALFEYARKHDALVEPINEIPSPQGISVRRMLQTILFAVVAFALSRIGPLAVLIGVVSFVLYLLCIGMESYWSSPCIQPGEASACDGELRWEATGCLRSFRMEISPSTLRVPLAGCSVRLATLPTRYRLFGRSAYRPFFVVTPPWDLQRMKTVPIGIAADKFELWRKFFELTGIVIEPPAPRALQLLRLWSAFAVLIGIMTGIAYATLRHLHVGERSAWFVGFAIVICGLKATGYYVWALWACPPSAYPPPAARSDATDAVYGLFMSKVVIGCCIGIATENAIIAGAFLALFSAIAIATRRDLLHRLNRRYAGEPFHSG